MSQEHKPEEPGVREQAGAGDYGGQGETSPRPEDGPDSTRPPANPDVDDDAVQRGEDKLDQAGH